MADLSNKSVAILATDGFDESELFEPLEVLKQQGAKVDIVAPASGVITGKTGKEAAVTHVTSDVDAGAYDALLLPGGVMNGDRIRLDPHAVSLTRDFFTQDKPIAAICHGGWILADADVLRGTTVTSFPSMKTDLVNAGAEWVDEEVVVDHGLITSRTPADIPAFNAKFVEAIAAQGAGE